MKSMGSDSIDINLKNQSSLTPLIDGWQRDNTIGATAAFGIR